MEGKPIYRAYGTPKAQDNSREVGWFRMSDDVITQKQFEKLFEEETQYNFNKLIDLTPAEIKKEFRTKRLFSQIKKVYNFRRGQVSIYSEPLDSAGILQIIADKK